MLKKLLLSLLLLGTLVMEGYSSYSASPYGVLSVRRSYFLNGIPYMISYDIQEYYGGSAKGMLLLYSPSSTASIFNYLDLKTAIADFDAVYNGYGTLNYINNQTASSSGTYYYIRNKDSFDYGTMK